MFTLCAESSPACAPSPAPATPPSPAPCSPSSSLDMAFELVPRDEAASAHGMPMRRASPPASLPAAEPPICSLQDLRAALSPPDPAYDIAEKPWLPGPQTPYLLYNCRLVDPRAGRLAPGPMTVCLAGGKVTRVALTTADDVDGAFRLGGTTTPVVKIDAAGFFVCPGLIDCHVHIMAVHGSATLAGAFTFPHETAVLRTAGTLRGMLANGFTTVRDTGGATAAHAAATDEFLIPGPRVFQGGRMLSQTGGHGDATDVWNDNGGGHGCCGGGGTGNSALGRLCDGVPACLQAARDNMRKGADHLKVCATGGIASATDTLESLQFTTAELQAITTVCRNMGGALVTAHCYTAAGVRHAVAGGVGGIEHGNLIDRETARFMAARGVFLTPTLALHAFITMPPYDRFETPAALRKNALVGDAGLRAIRYAEEAGVTVCFGTDTTGPTLVMQTYEFVVRGRLLPSPAVLRQATVNGARQLGMEGRLGELVEGAFADLLLLRENPLEDVACLDRTDEVVALVIKDGRIVKSRIPGLQPERSCEW